MSSLTYDSFWDDLSKGNVNPNADTFYLLLVTSAYAANKGTHAKRSDVTNEIAGSGYVAGGIQVVCAVAKDTVNHKETLTFSNVSWPNASLTARGGVVYKHRGGAAGSDELVGYLDFGADIISTNSTFAINFTAPITVQN